MAQRTGCGHSDGGRGNNGQGSHSDSGRGGDGQGGHSGDGSAAAKTAKARGRRRRWWAMDPVLGGAWVTARLGGGGGGSRVVASMVGGGSGVGKHASGAVTAACFLDIPAKSEPGCLLTKALSFHRPPKPCTPAWSSQLQVKVTSAKSG
uniref:Uncharacterized protein n=1 Tax=Oryza sativa subsp. japonica TaxID=39947 RepID=Q6YWG4_ORYSJ|nr:hypothetical protein [Oryza sativa Japonica Group]BAD10639.1 hypothetical protein [Oryza sativa Japonica Group]